MIRRTTYHKILLPWIAVFLAVLSFPIGAEAQRVSAGLDTTHYRIGEWIPLHLKAQVPAGTPVAWPLIDTNIEDIEVLKRTGVDSTDRDGMRLFEQTLTLTVFDSGYYPVPAFDFVINGDTLSTTPMLLRIHSVPLDTAALDVKPIKDPIDVPITLKEVLPWILAGAGAIALLALAWWFWKSRKREPITVEEPEITVPPHIWALEQLDILKREEVWQQGAVKTYYIKLTDILRRYIELRYRQPAMESTTDEIMDSLSLLSLPSDLTEKTRSMLVLSDFVKFAKAEPHAHEHEQSFETVLEFVQKTKAADEATPTNQNPS